jgi:cell division septation protein DedD
MATSQDTEITLGTGKMLVLFFGLVALCAVFFGMGFSLGRTSVKPVAAAEPVVPVESNGVRPSAVKPTSAPADLTFYKAVEQKEADTSAATQSAAPAPEPAASASPQPEPKPAEAAAAPSANGFYVQVAAVSKAEDAQSLVDALKKKQYAAFTSNNAASDKLFHVQVGPFPDIKDAEALRAKLVSDGYNPILKK